MVEENCKCEEAEECEYGYSVDVKARSREEAAEMLKDIAIGAMTRMLNIKEELAQEKLDAEKREAEKREAEFACYLRTGNFNL
jgi:hypothetical protein